MDNETIEQSTETIEQSSETVEQSSEVSNIEEIEEYEKTEEEAETKNEKSEETEQSEEEKPTSTVIQVVENEESETGYVITELDIDSLNKMSESYVENMLAVTPTTNDYYAFLGEDIESYFSGIMANYPLNEYRAYHLRHWIQNTSYSSYYDDYYYLYYDYPNTDCIEVYKSYNASNYQVRYTTAPILSSTITYGSEEGLSDIRKGVSYVEGLSVVCVIAGLLVLYIVGAIFKHLKS